MEQHPARHDDHQDRPPKPSARERQKWSALRKRSGALLTALAGRLPAEALEKARMYHFAGEWASLVNGLAYQLVHHQIPMTPAEKDALRDIMNVFERPHPRYRYIVNRDEVVDSLNLIDRE
jgi:hypothetical protein